MASIGKAVSTSKANNSTASVTSACTGSVFADEHALESGPAIESLQPNATAESRHAVSTSASKAAPVSSAEATAPNDGASFFGRQKEVQHLRDIWRHINDGQPIIPAALVWGTSGTGKSQLIEQFLIQAGCSCEGGHEPNAGSTQRPCNCRYVLRGKYDEYTGSNDPFSAIIQALDDFATQLKQGSSEELRRIQEAMGKAFSVDAGADAHTNEPNRSDADHGESTSPPQTNSVQQSYSAMCALIAVVPSLSILFSNSAGSSSSVTTNDASNNSAPRSADAAMDNASASTNSVLGHSVSDSMLDAGLDDSSQQKNAATKSSQSAWNRLCYIFIQFVKAISTPQRPVFLFLDDLQWSSAAGLELLASLLADTDLHNFMLLGAIRQEIDPHNHHAVELSPEAPLQRSFLDRLVNQNTRSTSANADRQNGNHDSSDRLLEQVTLGPLALPECTQWISHLLRRSGDDDDLKILASKIHQKTHGNVYFTLQAVEELKRSHIIVHNSTLGRWEWDLSQSTNGGNDELPIGDNIVAIIEMQLRSLPQDLQHVLSVAAYIRSTFDVHVLQMVLQHVDEQPGIDAVCSHDNESTLTQTAPTPLSASAESVPWTIGRLCALLDKAVLEGLVTNSIGESRYHFAHDRVQQAAYGLVPGGEVRDKLRLQIGHRLLDLYRASKATSAPNEDQEQQNLQQQHLIRDVDSLLFIAADHLNSVPTKDHLFLVSFNLEVGQKALRMVARTSASTYLQKAADALQYVRDPWSEYYETCLALFQCRSEVELSLGNFEVGHSIGNKILDKAQTLDDKLATYITMAVALGRENKSAESLSMITSVAKLLGECPKRFYLLHAMKDLMHIKSFLKNHTDEDIVNLPIQTEYRKTMATKVVCEAAYRSFTCGDWIPWVVHVLKHVRMTIRYGIDEDSATAFAVLGLFFNVSNQGHAAIVRCAEISHMLLKRVRGTQQTSAVHCLTGAWLYPYNEPFSKCIRILDTGYSYGMEAGTFDMALTNLQSRNTLALYFGYKLRPLVDALKDALRQFKVYTVTFCNGVTLSLLMMAKCLVGIDPIDWEAIERNMDHDQTETKENPKVVHRLVATYSGLPLLAALFRRYELAQHMTKLYDGLSANAKTYYFDTTVMLVKGLSAAALYRATGKAKYKKELKRQIDLSRDLVTNKGRNTTSLLQLLKAEQLSLKSIKANIANVRRTEEAYEVAIAVAEKSLLTHYCAIACEQAAEYFIRVMKTVSKHSGSEDTHALRATLRESACDYMTRAVEFYDEWNCGVKVKEIQERRSKYLAVRDTGGDADGRIVDMIMPKKIGFTANSIGPSGASQIANTVSEGGNSDAKWRQGSSKQHKMEGEGGGSRISSDPSKAKSTSDEGGDDSRVDDDLSVLTDGSR